MYSQTKDVMSKLLKNYKNKTWWRDVIVYRFAPLLLSDIDGTNILDEEWDNLIILDACRYDVFKELIEIEEYKIKGKLEYRISKGTDTPSFLLENFSSKQKYEDIVYVTANPYVNKLVNGRFYKIIPVWDKGWDKKRNTVLPQTTYEYALKAMKRNPNKRLIIHFVQPHHPYIRYPELKSSQKQYFFKIHSNVPVEVPKDLLLRAYKDNLKLALPYVKKLVNILPGKVVVTADHGEAFGELVHPLIPIRVYGHLRIKIPALYKVPWLIVDEKDKEKISLEEEIIKISVKKLKNERRV